MKTVKELKRISAPGGDFLQGYIVNVELIEGERDSILRIDIPFSGREGARYGFHQFEEAAKGKRPA